MTGTLAAPHRARAAAFVALTKPRIVELLLVTTVPSMILAAQGLPSLWLMAATIAGGAMAAGGANALNMYIDRDIDRLMHRTRNRPLVTGVVRPVEAVVFAVALTVGSFVWLWAFVNLLSAALARGGGPVLRFRVLAVAQADVHPQHRDRRARRVPCPPWWAGPRSPTLSTGPRWCCSR